MKHGAKECGGITSLLEAPRINFDFARLTHSQPFSISEMHSGKQRQNRRTNRELQSKKSWDSSAIGVAGSTR
jgi:hypothetical protein